MNRPMMVATILATMAMPAAADPPRAEQKAATNGSTPSPSISPERLARIRQALSSQIGVFDSGEGAMRAPTAGEAAALASPAPRQGTGAPQVMSLPSGGKAMRADGDSLSFLIVETQDNGKLALRHGPAKPVSNASQGGVHAR